METRLAAALAAIAASIALIVLVFAFAVWRDALLGALCALGTAFCVYVFQAVQSDVLEQQDIFRSRMTHNAHREHEPFMPRWAFWVYYLAFAFGFLSVGLAIFGV